MAGGVAAEVKSRLNIVDVIGETVQLKKAGTTYKGLCPFHGEKTPSFTVTPNRDSWKCFGCGLGGDVFSFVMQRDSVPFPEALRTLANAPQNLLDPAFRAEFVHKDAAVADFHCDTISRFMAGEDLRQDLPKGNIDIPKLKRGGVDLQVFACYVGPPADELERAGAAKKAFDEIEAVYRLVLGLC